THRMVTTLTIPINSTLIFRTIWTTTSTGQTTRINRMQIRGDTKIARITTGRATTMGGTRTGRITTIIVILRTPTIPIGTPTTPTTIMTDRGWTSGQWGDGTWHIVTGVTTKTRRI